MRWEFFAVRGYSALLENYAQGVSPSLDMGAILRLRNKIHYRIMNLPTAERMEPQQASAPIYEACRLGLVTYSLLVVFPVPLMTDPYPRLAQLLRSELDLPPAGLEIWKAMEGLRLWLLVMGGIAALGTVYRGWYVGRLLLSVERLQIQTWEQLRDVMTTIVWLNSPCDVEGLLLWREVQELRQYQ
jgi:hypothetical protein